MKSIWMFSKDILNKITLKKIAIELGMNKMRES